MKKRKYLWFIVEYENDRIEETDCWRWAFGEFHSNKDCLGVWGLPNRENANYETVLWHD